MTLSDQISRLERICAAIRTLYNTRSEKEHDQAIKHLLQLLKTP
jgi:hypothetical protein